MRHTCGVGGHILLYFEGILYIILFSITLFKNSLCAHYHYQQQNDSSFWKLSLLMKSLRWKSPNKFALMKLDCKTGKHQITRQITEWIRAVQNIFLSIFWMIYKATFLINKTSLNVVCCSNLWLLLRNSEILCHKIPLINEM